MRWRFARLNYDLSVGRGWSVAAVYLLAVAGLGSILAWSLIPYLDVSFERLLSRAILLLAALGLWPLSRILCLSAQEVGWRPVQWSALVWAWPLGLLSLLPVVLFFMVTGFRVVDDRVVYLSAAFWVQCLMLLASSVLVGLFEEVLFRGVMFAALRRVVGFVTATVVVSTLYAAAHFLQDTTVPQGSVNWYSGLQQVVVALAGLLQASGDWDSFVALFLLGALFCWVRQKHGLWWCVGLHAAWVFGIRLVKELTVRDVVNPYQGWVGGYDNFVGHLVSVWLLFGFVLLALHQHWRAEYSPARAAAQGGSTETSRRQ